MDEHKGLALLAGMCMIVCVFVCVYVCVWHVCIVCVCVCVANVVKVIHTGAPSSVPHAP